MIGHFAFSKAGHDKGTLYVVVAEEKDFVYLCDGRLKTMAAPKKKRLRHIQLVNRTVEAWLKEKFSEGGKVYDEEIKRAVKQYKEQYQTNQREETYV